ncbi:cytidine and dCMP deaminase domain-containing protein 1 isoform X1 [Hemiscyllium ocellatum]|uniref:cytidine and dCMP deaminase domain-containing protein 1 isoform X1 n=1 Tax=Hemiscyllium ocellatum TaxID=170820 RepID=UPI0029667B7A|nr:cytidine and dCMP deaminase domain-containing protein 1 isoform X1 [Hemiscyllium ocellatum]
MSHLQEPACQSQERGAQTECNARGLSPRLSKVNFFTLLSLWMELFPNNEQKTIQRRKNGLVVVHNSKIIGLHCSSAELHAGQIAVVKHGSKLKDCDLYFSRKPCSTCLKMVLNAGVNRISYWPGDPEISLVDDYVMNNCNSDAKLDAKAVERLKSNSRSRICTLLQPLAYNMLQFVEETSKKCEFLQSIVTLNRDFKLEDFFTECRRNRLQEFEKLFLISNSETHKEILKTIGLENVCDDIHFTNLRHKMEDLVFLLATVDCSVPEYGTFRFYCDDSDKACDEHTNDEFQNFARHCMVQARLLAYRTEDQKIGVGAVIWAEGKSNNCDGTGARYLIGCGYNAYPMGSEYADYPQMDEKQQKDREARKFRYIVHAEQNALTFRCQDIKDEEKTMIFVTKCPCDECVPLINNAGIKQIYTGDLDAGKVKADISYQKFSGLQGVRKFTWQEAPTNSTITSSGHTTHRKRGPNKSFILQSTLSTGISNTAIIGPIGSTTLSASTLESSVLEDMEIMENPQSPLGKGDLKRPLTTPWSESQKEELLNLEINEPAFKRRLVEQQSYLQSLLTSVQVMNDAVDRMMMTMSRLNSSLSDVQNLLKHKLTAFQTTREEASPQIVSVVENSFIQGLSNIGTSLQNSLNTGISDVGSKVQESLQMGFESLGEKILSTMREGYANMITEQICAHQNLSDKYERALPSRGLHNSSQEVGTHDGSQLHHPSQLSSGSSLESRIPTTEVQIPGGTKI